MFGIGRYRYDRLCNLDPRLPIPSAKNTRNYNCLTAEQKELIRLFMLNQPVEPGCPCQNRSIPIYMEDANVTFSSCFPTSHFPNSSVGR